MAKEKEINYSLCSANELLNHLDQKKESLFKVRFKAASAPVKNTMEIRNLRREIARINTYINQRRQKP